MMREIDEAGFQAAREHAERIDWLPDDGTEADRQDGYRQLREILSAYLDALPSAEPGRDRIAVVTTSGNLAAAQVLYRRSEVSEYTWQCLEAKVGSNWGLARAIIRCNLPRPAEPVEVEGSVEVVGP